MEKTRRCLVSLTKTAERTNGKDNPPPGFTIMEVLIVVVIIGILATIALPNFTKSIEISRAELGKTVLRQIYTAEKMYHLA